MAPISWWKGHRYAEALERCQSFIAASGALSVHAYDHPATLLGQGSVGLELEEQAPKLDTLFVAVGGGGLIGGIAAWYRGRVKIVGVEPERAPTLHAALAAGKPVEVPVGGIAADSLGASRIGGLAFAIAQRHVDRVMLVADETIRDAQLALWERLRIVAEPGGAAALAPLLSGAYVPSERRACRRAHLRRQHDGGRLRAVSCNAFKPPWRDAHSRSRP